MTEDVERTETEEYEKRVVAREEGWEAVTPWFSWIMGPAAWALHQGIGYAMIPLLCRLDTRWPYHALTVFSVSLCLAGGLWAFRVLRHSRRIRPRRSEKRLRMMALGGLMLCALSLLGILVEYVGSFWLSVCEGIN